MDLSTLDEPLEMIMKFEDQVLAPLRVMSLKDLGHGEKISKSVDWPKLIDKLAGRFQGSNDLRQIDRVFLALLDNPRLSKEVIYKYLPEIYGSEKVINNAKLCLEQRDEVKSELFSPSKLSVIKSSKALKELLRSDRGEISNEDTDLDIQIVLLVENLKYVQDRDEKERILKEFLHNCPDLVTKPDFYKLFHAIEQIDKTLLETIVQD